MHAGRHRRCVAPAKVFARIRAEVRTTLAFVTTGSTFTSTSARGVPTRVDCPENGVPTAVLSRDAAAVVSPEAGGADTA